MTRLLLPLSLGLALAPPAMGAEPLLSSRVARKPLLQQAQPLIPVRSGAGTSGASLFAGRAEGGLFSAVLEPTSLPHRIGGDSVNARIRDIIARAEAGPDGYDAVQHGARRRPPKRPTAMTLDEIFAWIAATPGQPHAIGRYQFIPDTLRMLVNRLGLDRRTRFTPGVQDRLADLLLLDAGLDDMRRGNIPRRSFMHNLARIWAGLPTASGRSHYHGHAGNRATMTWARFESAMAPIFPH